MENFEQHLSMLKQVTKKHLIFNLKKGGGL